MIEMRLGCIRTHKPEMNHLNFLLKENDVFYMLGYVFFNLKSIKCKNNPIGHPILQNA